MHHHLGRRGLLKASLGNVGAMLLARAALAAGTPAILKIGLASAPTSIDPHFHYRPDNLAVAAHIFDTLVTRDEAGAIRPALAETWQTVDGLTWEFHLRKDVRFSDGSPFSAADVVFSLDRVGKIEASPAPLTVVTREIVEVQAKGPDLVVIRTQSPYPLLLPSLSQVPIVSRVAAQGAKSSDFDEGKAAIGTGPYKFSGWVRGQEIRLARNDGYWGTREPWEQVQLLSITNAAVRETAVLAGDVDLIEKPTGNDMAQLRERASVFSVVTNRIIYLLLNVREAVPAGIAETDGKNPLHQPEVRAAISFAIPRKVITDRMLPELTQPANSLVPSGSFGSSPTLALPYDPNRAKQLLAQAGWDKGFGLTIISPTEPDLNHIQIMQAVSASLTRLGIRVKLDAVPQPVLLSKRASGEFSAYTLGYGPDPDNGLTLKGLGMTSNRQAGEGLSNFSGFSDPAFDSLTRSALATISDDSRAAAYGQMLARVNESLHVIPLYFEPGVWVARRGIRFVPRNDGRTLAMNVRP